MCPDTSMDTERGLAVSGTTLATARGGVSKQRGWEAEEICALYKWIMKSTVRTKIRRR
jgi:hypothetical protein